MPRPTLFLVDSFGFIFRAYHARARSSAPPMRNSKGVPTEATYIFNNMIRRIRDEYQPDFLAAVFESEEPNFRTEMFEAYKANRTETPPDLLQQIPDIKRVLEAMRVPVVECSGFEADDVIGTLARRAAVTMDVMIVSSDKDMLQLVTPHVRMLNPMKDDTIYDEAGVEAFMGVRPPQVVDLLALKGDSVDNIPGAPGIGEKGARDLIAEFGSVEQAIAQAEHVKRKMYRESLQNNHEQILLSKDLARIRVDAPVEIPLEDLAVKDPDAAALEEVYRELEFGRALREVQTVVEEKARDFRLVHTAEEAEQLSAEVTAAGRIALVLTPEIPGEEGTLDETPFCYFATAPGVVRAVVPAHAPLVRLWWNDAGIAKVFHDWKQALLTAPPEWGLPAGEIDDVFLMGFLLYADPGLTTVEALAGKRFERGVERSLEAAPDLILRLADDMKPALARDGLEHAYREIDLPLSPVLARMEAVGIRVDTVTLASISERMGKQVEDLTARIHALAGHEFNVNSPQQLAKVLFEEMNLPAPVKTGKGKVHSTAVDVLEGLALHHEIAALVMEYRQLAKLKGTYVDALPQLIRPATGRIHTSFNQAGAATGRLSSSNPNLQNIPIRTEQGREIRAAFMPREGWLLLSADYSQIELRLLAHFSEDPVLMSAFRNGEDIHTRTAAEVFDVMPQMVSPQMRREAKVVNFGIVYGQTAFGLATQLGIPKKEAENYIRNYFERYAGVRKWIDATIAEVRETGRTRTMFGRTRLIPDMEARNPNSRSFAERTAVNTPLQGSAADLIKIAMIRIDREMTEKGLAARMLLQVHDELVFEAPPEERDTVAALVKRQMEHVTELSVPLLVEIGIGPNWRDAK
ncbi:MAG: DNA polymerase I [Bryobacterales bacterium]|nr:DNA polymerase I [Bryobacterales bacterium]